MDKKCENSGWQLTRLKCLTYKLTEEQRHEFNVSIDQDSMFY